MAETQEIWYKQLGFKENPFKIGPGRTDIIGYGSLVEEIFYRIDAGNMLFIHGEPGSGKTSILKHIIRIYKGKKIIIYISAATFTKDIELQTIIRNAPRKLGKTKEIILLLDEINSISEKNAEIIKFFFDEGIIQSVIFTGIDYNRVDFTESLRHRIGNRILRLSKLTEEDAVLMIRSRIGDNQILPNSVIKSLWAISNKNPRMLLENCEDICKYVIRIGKDRVKESDIEEVFGE